MTNAILLKEHTIVKVKEPLIHSRLFQKYLLVSVRCESFWNYLLHKSCFWCENLRLTSLKEYSTCSYHLWGLFVFLLDSILESFLSPMSIFKSFPIFHKLSQNVYSYFPTDVHLDCFQLFTTNAMKSLVTYDRFVQNR